MSDRPRTWLKGDSEIGNSLDEGLKMERWFSPGSSMRDRIALIVPWIFEWPGPDTSNPLWLHWSMEKMIQNWLRISSSVSMAHSIAFIWIDLTKMEIWSNAGIATLMSSTPGKIFLQVCNEAISGRLKWDMAYDYIKGRCELLSQLSESNNKDS